jgi:hypothetical protein
LIAIDKLTENEEVIDGVLGLCVQIAVRAIVVRAIVARAVVARADFVHAAVVLMWGHDASFS